jgi:TRAP-type C4-dicarboxylate transport system substrate-binding protein
MQKGAKKVEDATDGRIRTKYYGGGSMGDEKDVVRKMRLKQLDGSALTSVGLSMIYPGIRVLQLPNFYASVEEVDYVREQMWPYFQDKFRAEGFELLAAGDVGWIYLFSTKPVRSRADLKGLKIWVWDGDPQSSGVFKEMGIVGIPLGVPEVLSALQSGRINACFGSPLAAVALQWHSKVKYMASMPVGYGIGGLVMRTDVWERASAEDIATQQKIGKKMMKESIQRVRKDNERARKAIVKQGIQVIDTPTEVHDEFVKHSEKMWQAWVGSIYTQDELDLVLKYRAEFRAKSR